jgi:predicted P-loop ATPase
MVEMWLISAVARALDPGCQADSALVLQGGQGKGKTTWFETLFGEFFTNSVNKNNFGTPNALMTVHTIWGVELAEVDSIVNSKEAGQIKSFVTARKDHMRKPYLREIDEFPRPCIFCATVNPSRFLVDDENRRFWPIPIPDDCDLMIETLIKERDGIWLSALRAYEATKGQKYAWWPTELEKIEIRRVTGAFEEIDVWQDVIEDYLNTPDERGNVKNEVRILDILTKALHLLEKDCKKMEQRRVGRILDHIGWKKEVRRENPVTGSKERLRARNTTKITEVSGNNGSNGTTQSQQQLELDHITPNNMDHPVTIEAIRIDTASGIVETQSQQALIHNAQINQFDSRLFEKNNQDWKPISTVGLENLYRGDWIACSDGIPLKLEKRTKKFWYAQRENSEDSLEVPFSEIVHVYR